MSDTIPPVTISMAFGISTELRDTFVMHYVARAKILAFQARINPVPHSRERLPLPVSNESLCLASQPHHDAFLVYQFNFSNPRVCLRVWFYFRLSLPFSVSTTNVLSSAKLEAKRKWPRPFASSPEDCEDDQLSTGRELECTCTPSCRWYRKLLEVGT